MHFFILSVLDTGARSTRGGGCSDVAHEPRPASVTPPRHAIAASLPFGPKANRQFDFGDVLGGSGSTLIHEFEILNSTGHAVKLISAINAKPCCGEIESFQPGILTSGEKASLKIKLKLGQIGQISHRALIETDLESVPVLEFWTLASSHPRFSIVRAGADPDQETSGDIRILIGREYRGDYKFISLGSPAEPAEELEDVEISSVLAARWVGSSQERLLENGLSERSRLFSVAVRSGELGRHTSEIAFSRSGRILTRTMFDWATQPTIVASPSGLIISSAVASKSYSIRLASTHQTEFSLRSIRCTLPSVEVKVARNRADRSYDLLVRHAPAGSGGDPATGVIIVETSDSWQPTVKIGVYVSMSGGRDEGETTK